MSSNSITGDSLVSKIGNKEQQDKYSEGFDRIFGKKKKPSEWDESESEWDESELDRGDAKYQQEKDDATM